MKKWSRRDFAKHAGLATLFTPFISLLDGAPAQAATGKAKYFLLFFTNGTDPDTWSPKGSTESSIKFSAMTQPLSAIKDSVVLVDNLNGGGTSGNHDAPGGLCGRGYGEPVHVSLDQFISDGLKTAGVNTQIPNLILGGVSDQKQSTFYRKGQALTPIFSPSTAFSTIFGGAPKASPMPAMSGSSSVPVVDTSGKRRKSILDLMVTQLGQLEQSLGASERAKLEAHAESIRQLEKRLEAQSMPAGAGGSGGVVATSSGCKAPTAPGTPSEPLLASSMMLPMAIQALGCDLTRVASVQFGHHQACPISLKEVSDAAVDWHQGLFHSEMAPHTHLVKLEAWLCGEFVKAAQMLKSLPAPDGNGTLYDQTLMLWARDMGDAVLHTDSNMRFVFAGGAGGFVKHSADGRYINGGGARHNKALVSACEALGVSATGFGDGSEKTGLSLS
jgi:Protein of unknown function (DUF1552)